ncbi:hypothetical protein QEM14_003141 [Pseudomonas putida]|nr:hypothetical protein [Pseudomonas putida]
MGIELDVLVGHPEHDLLFIAAQVAKAAGITDPKYAIRDYLHRVAMVRNKPGMQIKELLVGNVGNSPTITEEEARAVIHYPRWRDAWVLNESSVYEMLTRGHAPQSEPFRKWVFEEVLPSIRKTGRYDASESSDPIAVGIMDGDVAKPLTMAALPQRPQEDHKHDQLRPSPARGDHHRCTLRSQAWPGPTHQDHRQLILRLHRADHRLRSISPLRNGHP